MKNLACDFKIMSDLVFQQLNNLKIQLSSDEDAKIIVDTIRKNEEEIDRLEVRLREDVVTVIGLQSPRASDLRKVIAYFDMVGDLERTGDLVSGISKRLILLKHPDSLFDVFKTDLINLFEMSDKMIQNAIFAFNCENNMMARNVIDADHLVDKFHYEIQMKLLSHKELVDKTEIIEDTLNLGRVLYNIERIGDYATNISEAVVFATEGRDIKHEKNNE
ncbi:MAG: PhoU domain-containing protein [Bacteroidales bacterium]|jgi:phosphate transport system protein|nr:PhoU domain-containing protein [Bacteroidales bacterium]MDD3152878.1 PhoU domain-containing protein [Bacteroidales bacterium]MDD3913532.1 PhoU domain-containing protein [Bacteroidales bacterium]MDD4634157.1 PhoU domain-containing protein [Bacteroidales bacterium]